MRPSLFSRSALNLLTLSAGLVVVGTACAGGGHAPLLPNLNQGEAQIREAYGQLAAATVKGEWSTAQQLYAPTFQGWGTRLELESREALTSPVPGIKVKAASISPREFGADGPYVSVVAEHNSTLVFEDEGGPQELTQKNLSRDLWQKQSGRWQMVSSTTLQTELNLGGQMHKVVNPHPLTTDERQRIGTALRSLARPLSLDANAPTSDLAFLKPLADARLIGAGEGSHGTHEHFILKARIFKALVQQYGFNTLMFESNMGGAEAVNAYLSGQSDDVSAALRGLGFAVWRTEEVRDLLTWMRQYNATRGSREALRFVAVDMQDAGGSARLLAQLTQDAAVQSAVRPFLDIAPYSLSEAFKDAAVKTRYLAEAEKLVQAVDALPASTPRLTDLKALARNVQQTGLEASGSGTRDSFMAENVLSHLNAEPAARVMLWAHNSHVSRAPEATGYSTIDMGKQLAGALGSGYRTIGQSFVGGKISALAVGDKQAVMKPVEVAPAHPDSPEALLLPPSMPAAALTFADANTPLLSSYFATARPIRGIGNTGQPGGMGYLFEVLPKAYDVLLVVRESTAARPAK